MISIPLCRYIFKAIIRDKLILSFLAIMIVGASLSVFLGGGAVTEKNHFISIFAAGGLRIAGLVSLILFITSFVRRAFETQDIDFLLSRPLGRTVFIVSHACSFMILALIFAVSISSFLKA